MPPFEKQLTGVEEGAETSSRNYLGEAEIPVKYIAATTLIRTTTTAGIKKVADSIESQGWLPQFAPSVLISAEHLGGNNAIPSKVYTETIVRILDGNHRREAFRKVFGDDAKINVRVYREFGHSGNKIVANSECMHPLARCSNCCAAPSRSMRMSR